MLRPEQTPHLGVWFSTPSSTVLPHHTHDAVELNLVLSGSLTYEVSGQTRQVRPGELLAIFPGTSHRLVTMAEDTALWVLELPARETFPLSTDAGGAPTFLLHEEVRAELMRLIRKLWLRPKEEAAGTLTQELYRQLGRPMLAQASPVAPLHEGVVRAKRMCERAENTPLDMSELAKRSGVSRSRLTHLFQEQVGLTPLQYRNYCRVQHFIRSYQKGERHLIAAALAAGFGSYPQFHRVFRQVCGIAPRDHLDWLDRRGIDRRLSSDH